MCCRRHALRGSVGLGAVTASAVVSGRDRAIARGSDRDSSQPIGSEMSVIEAGAPFGDKLGMVTILVVDDLSANRALLVTLLRHQGHRLIEAGDGRQGLAAAQAEHPDLVITDVLMPVMDGYELVRQLRLDPATRGIPVVFYTAHYGEREARALALSSGVSYVLTKPAQSQEVLAIVSRVLSGESATRVSPDTGPLTPAFDGAHLRLLTDKLSEKAGDLRAAIARLRGLINIGLELGSERDPNRLLERVCVAARDLFGATYVTLGILDRTDRTVQRIVADGADAARWIKPGDALSGILATVVAEQRTVRGENPGGDPVALQLPALHPEVQAFLVAPVASLAHVYGWICLVGNEGRPFTEEDEHLLLALGGQVGRIHENGYFYSVALKRAEELEHEILERRQAEHALRTSERLNRTLVAHLPHRILVKDRHSVILFCSANYAKDVGLAPEDVIGKDAFAFYPRPLAEADHADDQDVMDRGIVTSVEEPYPLGGPERWAHTVKVPYRDEQGHVIGILVVFEDITERRSLEAQYQQAQRMEVIGRLAGGVAHDFNNVLTVIVGHCELLLADFDPADARHADILEIQRAGVRAAGLTRQLLAFSRKEIIQPTLLDLNEVVADMRGMLGRLIGEDVQVVLDLHANLRLFKADRGQVEQIIMNFAVNARDAMPRGGRLTIETANLELDEPDSPIHPSVTPGVHVVLTVTDTGSGMTPQVQARLFEPFFTTKEPGKGTGLGLATVHGIITRCGGSINVHSEVGRGTSFRVYFPQADAAEPPLDALPPMARSPDERQTILVVEDTEGLRTLAKRLLERQGYTVLLATNADEALELFEQHATISVLLTDVVMPGASGPELTRRLVGQRPDLKVIYMSGYTGDAISRHGVLDPDIAFLHKPFTSDTLCRKIREVLDIPRSSLSSSPHQ
jgi:PAS domain S-box-containing protein